MSTNNSSNMNQPTTYSHHNQQYPETSTGPATTTVPQQFDQTCQQFFSQSEITGQDQNATPFRSTMTTAPVNHSLNTDASGDGSPGYQAMSPVHTASAQQQQQPLPGTDAKIGGKLESVQQASAARPPTGPFDLPERGSHNVSGVTSTTASAIPDNTNMHPEQEALMRGRSADRTFNNTFTATADEHLDPAMTSSCPTISVVDVTTPHKIHIASDDAVKAAHAEHAADAATHGRRRSSFSAFVEKIRSVSRSRSRSRSPSKSRSPSLSRRLSRSLSRHSLDEEEEEEEVSGPYKEVKLAQREYLKNLRAEQERQGITHNVDGLPIPPPENRQRRHSSVGHILGLDKPLLSL